MLPFISNHYEPGMVRPKLDVSTQIVLEPNDEWSYAHHPFLTKFKGRFYLCFSNGHCHEDDVGQRVLYTASDDFAAWETPKVLAEPDRPETCMLIPSGMYATEDRLVAYYLMLEYKPEVLRDGHRRMGSAGRIWHGTFCITSEDGVHWSKPQHLEAFGGNKPVCRLKSGRLFSCGGRTQAYSDCQDGVHGWKQVEVCPEGYGNNPEDVRPDDDMPGLVSDTHVALCESSCIQQDDGTMYLYLRSATPWLWACRSDDEGETWTLPEKTNFTDNRTKFFMDRLPDGRYYYVGTPDPFPPRTRHVLALSLSKDGLDWTQHYLLADAQYKGRYPGIDKNGVYGYPCVLVEDNMMYIAVSINKEMIAVMKTDIRQLQTEEV